MICSRNILYEGRDYVCLTIPCYFQNLGFLSRSGQQLFPFKTFAFIREHPVCVIQIVRYGGCLVWRKAGPRPTSVCFSVVPHIMSGVNTISYLRICEGSEVCV